MVVRPGGDGFRPDLEGLRGLAVALVLLFHAGVPGFPGGFVGVDVFFVLSGYLITGLIVRELEDTGGVSLAAFYARRARRLLPAAALALAATVLAAAVVLPPLRVPDVAADGFAAALYASNMRFAAQATDYLGAQLDPSPLLHFWSLGVEEQFYLTWPALLIAAAAVGRGRIGHAGAAVAAVCAGSLAISIWLTAAAQPWAFFSLPSRAWELALGGALALPWMRSVVLPARIAALAGAAGIGMVVAAGSLVDRSAAFPGTVALVPTLGTALVIAAGMPGPHGPASRLLTMPPVRWLGRISYSLYLWHWPMLILPAVAAERELAGVERLGLAALAVLVAAASHRWVEEPFRRGRIVGTGPRPSLASAAVVTLALAVTSVGVGLVATPGPAVDRPQVADVDLATLEEELDLVLDGLGQGASGTTASSESTGARETASGSVTTGGPGSSGAPGSAPGTASGSVTTGAPRTASPTGPGDASSAPPTGPTEPPSTADPSEGSLPAGIEGAGPAGASVPATPAGPVPAALRPGLEAARDDLPRIYADGCHLGIRDVEPGRCAYGADDRAKTIVLFGDSHAGQWFPALERLADVHGWQLVSLTKAACAAVDATVWSPVLVRAYTECDHWRSRALARIAAERPELVIVSNSRAHAMVLDGRPAPVAEHRAAWVTALRRTLRELQRHARAVAVIGDTPRAKGDPPACLSRHHDETLACTTPRAEALAVDRVADERGMAAASGATFIDPTAWVCPSEPCPVVLGRILVYRDGNHMTATFAAALAARLEGELLLLTG